MDKFLDYYIALEMQASIMGYENVKGFPDVKKFSKYCFIIYKPDGEVSIRDNTRILGIGSCTRSARTRIEPRS